MKPPRSLPSAHRPGFALVIVLGVMVLVVAMIVGFLSRVSTERTAAGGFAASANARQLADKAVSIVQAQINDATTHGMDIAWTSQPGMVRTFDTSGNLVNAYKLYSADKMISTAVSLDDDFPATTWTSDSAIWVDLNAPVTANGTVIYPIMDPAGQQPLNGFNAVEGFSINGANAVKAVSGTSAYQPAPMPVRWLYVLQNGTLVAPTGSGSSATISGASATNPIVGRVAFWTDDDTCKVNINTAGGGVNADDTYWDTPRSYTQTDVYDYALCQPVQREFQRYPGHPGTVMLSSALSGSGWTLSDYLNLTPRMTFGGSEGGTVSVDEIATSGAGSLPPKTERLYASVDELIFDKNRAERTNLSKAAIESRKFFLTAHSRAPEENLFNLPRIAIWPLYKLSGVGTADPLRTTAFDRLIAFCSSTGTSGNFLPYFFQRQNALSTTNDIGISRNGQLYQYLQSLTGRPIPGFGGGSFNSKYSADRDQILTEIFDYIRITNLNDDLITTPTYRFTSGTDSQVNTNFGVVLPTQIGSDASATYGMGRWLAPMELLFIFSCDADASVAASNYSVDTTIGGTTYPANKMLADPPFTGPPYGTALTTGQKRIQVAFVPQMYGVAGGWKQMYPSMRMEVIGLDTLTVNGQQIGFPSDAYVDQNQSPIRQSGGSGYGGPFINGFWPAYKKAPYPVSGTATIPSSPQIGKSGQSYGTNYPFIGHPVTISDSQLSLSGSNITVEFYDLDSTNAPTSTTPVQTLKIKIPTGSFPTPTLSTNSNYWSWYTDASGTTGRLYHPSGGSPTLFAQGASAGTTVDVVRGILVGHGDYRLATGAPLIDDSGGNLFVPHSRWTSTDSVAAVGVPYGGSASNNYYADGFGAYVSGVKTSIPGSGMRTMPTSPSVDASATGDFDTGDSCFVDGPYINKADEGTMDTSAGTSLILSGGKQIPYYHNINQGANDASFFSPNRMIPSPVMFGSLPTGIKAGTPWQTLLFRPPAQAEAGHKGATSPVDSLLLDLFWMPVVEPFAISDCFSTMGKINMNYQIIPFTYIERSTAVRAVLKAEKLAAIANSQTNVHPYPWGPPASLSGSDRLNLDPDATLKQFTDRFASQISTGKNIFVSPSEICNLYMVPQGQTASGMAAWWNGYRQTGDNMREKIYATVYPKLTTKSNTFTVHFRAQSLKKVPSTSVDTWIEGRDIVTGEYRGFTTIERYINPDANIPDYASNISANTLDSYYKWRVVENRQFAP
jgi:hypothetical protein